LNILFVGDIFGSAGRRIVREHIGHVCEANNVELLIINAENAAGGFGLTPQIAEEFFDMGADVLTTGACFALRTSNRACPATVSSKVPPATALPSLSST
jgi:calcineurin-like phosphoesterase